jgi:hypothetical protein
MHIDATLPQESGATFKKKMAKGQKAKVTSLL